MKRDDLVVVVNRDSCFVGSVGRVVRVLPFDVMVSVWQGVGSRHRFATLPFGRSEVRRVEA